MTLMDRAMSQSKMRGLNHGNFGWNSEAILVIKFPDPRILLIISRSLFFALVLLTLPCIVSILSRESSSEYYSGSDMVDFEQLDLVFHDLANEGLFIKGNKALILSHGTEGLTLIRVLYYQERKIEIVLDSDFDQTGLFPDESFDFVFASGSLNTKFVDRILRIGGVLAFPFSNDPSLPNHLQNKSNYRPVYLKRYTSIIVAMRKTSLSDHLVYSSASRRLLENRKTALKVLEDVLLEPPTRNSANPNKFSAKIKYLPNLISSLQRYQRRLFVTVGRVEENRDMIEYFHENYPKKDQEFEVYKIDLKPEEASSGVAVSDWLMENVKEEDYVVMKAEAEVVENLLERRTIHLVNELFLECKNQWWEDGSGKKSNRAYWECLSLYGRLRDEGVAVHQWWD